MDCDPIGLKRGAASLDRAGCSVLPQPVWHGDDAVGCSPASEFYSSFSNRLSFFGLCSSAAAADARPCADSRYLCPIPGEQLMLCTFRSGATSSAPLLKGRTSGQAVEPAGRPELNPSADDKAAFLVVPDDGGNSGAAEAGTPSTACDSLSIRRPVSSFPRFTLAGTAGSKSQCNEVDEDT